MPLARRTPAAVLSALLAVLLHAAPARATDLTDMWWNPTESGWGLNVVQADSNLWLTFFVYGADRKPTWYSAYIQWDGGKFTGPLYATTGSYFAGPWNPAEHPDAVNVGTATFTPSGTNAYEATLSYTVSGAGAVTKSIERQYLGPIALSGTYAASQAGTYGGCSSSGDNGSYIDAATLTVSQTTANAITLAFGYGSGANCTLSGTAERKGPLFQIANAAYKCTGKLTVSTTANVYEVRKTSLGVEGRFTARLSSGCQETASFAAVLR
jgi:hypothetical protein